MNIVVCGSRTFDDYELLEEKLDAFTAKVAKPVILSGGCKGADKLGEWWAFKNKLEVRVYHADWQRHGKKAGPLRNSEMVEAADALIAFWDGLSKGTANIIGLARAAGIPVRVVKSDSTGFVGYMKNTGLFPCEDKKRRK